MQLLIFMNVFLNNHCPSDKSDWSFFLSGNWECHASVFVLCHASQSRFSASHSTSLDNSDSLSQKISRKNTKTPLKASRSLECRKSYREAVYGQESWRKKVWVDEAGGSALFVWMWDEEGVTPPDRPQGYLIGYTPLCLSFPLTCHEIFMNL